MIFVMKFQAAAMSRSDTPEDQRKDFCLYVDEFQNFSTDSFATIMSEARKYHLNLIVANQFTTQLTEEIRDAVFGNIGTIVSFRIGQNDVDALSRYFQPAFDGEDLLRVPNANTIVRTLVNGVPTQPFSMATLPPLGNPNPHLAEALKQLSAAKYGQPRNMVEKAIFDRLATRTPAPKPFQSPFGPGGPGGGSQGPSRPTFGNGPLSSQAATQVPEKAGAGSFLDEWMAKQRAKAPAPMLSPAHSSLPPAMPSPPEPPGMPIMAPTPAALRPEEPKSEPTQEGNVSSAQLDQEEIDDIAAELKKGLKPAGLEPGEVSKEAESKGSKANTEAVLHLKQPSATKPSESEDTIYIDSDGKLQVRGVEADQTEP
jgi:hypothetical protein